MLYQLGGVYCDYGCWDYGFKWLEWVGKNLLVVWVIFVQGIRDCV